MKIIKKSIILKATLIFYVLSSLFLYALYASSKSLSTINYSTLNQFMRDNLVVLIISLVGLFSVYFFMKSMSKILLVFASGVMWTLLSQNNFLPDKFTLLSLFVYLLIAIIMSLVLNSELLRSIYNPKFQLNDLELNSIIPVKVHIKGENAIVGHVTNFDETGCFLKTNRKPTNKDFWVEFEFCGKKYRNLGKIVSQNAFGIGLEFNKEKGLFKNTWQELFHILVSRGYNN